jgi:hypothetical protein
MSPGTDDRTVAGCSVGGGFEVGFESLEVAGHVLGGLAPYDEGDEQLADAVPIEVDVDGGPGAGDRGRAP